MTGVRRHTGRRDDVPDILGGGATEAPSTSMTEGRSYSWARTWCSNNDTNSRSDGLVVEMGLPRSEQPTAGS